VQINWQWFHQRAPSLVGDGMMMWIRLINCQAFRSAPIDIQCVSKGRSSTPCCLQLTNSTTKAPSRWSRRRIPYGPILQTPTITYALACRRWQWAKWRTSSISSTGSKGPLITPCCQIAVYWTNLHLKRDSGRAARIACVREYLGAQHFHSKWDLQVAISTSMD